MDAKSWIADGTPDREPVTTETPTETVAEAVIEAPEGQPRDEHGRFAAATTDDTAAGETAAGQAATETAAAAAVQAFIDARLGDQPFQIPQAVLLPQKRGETVEYRPIEDVLREGMMGRDYHLKTTEVATLRREAERMREENARTQARIEARQKYLDEREAELKSTLTDPKGAAAYQEHLIQYQNNPIYRRNVDAALRQRETEAELAAYRETADARIVAEASETARGWITGMASEFPGVDPQRVAQLYGHALQAGTAQLDPSVVRSIYQAEQTYLDRMVSPLRSELAEIKATLAQQVAAKATESRNATTQHAVQRAKSVPVSTGGNGGAPSTRQVPATKFTPSELPMRNSEWIKAGR